MAEALVSLLLEQFASIVQAQVEQEVRLVVNVKEDVAKLTHHFKAIEGVLEDAEERQVKDPNVRHWLESLKDVSYEMDDVLDEWNTEILKRSIERQEKEAGKASVPKRNKVCFFIPAHWLCFGQFSHLIRRRDIAIKIKELDERLSLIASEREKYNFQYTKRGIQQLEHQKTSSFVGQTFGRDDEKLTLVSKLLSESSQGEVNPLVIPVVGMGGIGKTTLAQLAYNDEKVQAHFDSRVWVCVSEPFDEIKVARAISEGLRKDSVPNVIELQTLLQFIDESVKGKKFLLVLDDVWTEDEKKWEQLKLSLQNAAVGSKIVVTTRKIEVAKMMRATKNIINVKELGDENCWLLFCQIALADRDTSEHSGLEGIGRKIVAKCKGLPLAAKTLGGLMYYKRTRKEWEDVLSSKIWELDVFEQKVFQPLLLSYYDLAPVIKRCLLYCVIFPKDKVIYKEQLIELWMSQNYLNSSGKKEKGTVGEMCFENLVMRSFFQEFMEDDLGNIERFKMHDIVHDFLQFLTKDECFFVEANGGSNKIDLPGDKARHLTLMFAPEGPFILSSRSCKNLRTFSTFDSKITTFGPGLFLQLKCLRTLDLSHNQFEEVPNEVGELVHLRYLDLSNNYALGKLPESVCNLFNLQTLGLMWLFRLHKLPQGMARLISLQHLHVIGCEQLSNLPKGIARLTSLRRLDAVYLSDDDNNYNNEASFKLSDLRNMDELCGSLGIFMKSHLNDAGEAEKAQLVNKRNLLNLRLCFPINEKQMDNILDALRPHPNLEQLSVSSYSGSTLGPKWLMSLNNLRKLTFSDCHYCEFLPAMGKLASLETLKISRMSSVKKVGVEFLGVDQSEMQASSSSSLILFPKLKQLEFSELHKWEEWTGMAGSGEEDDFRTTTIMPCLNSLTFTKCHMLKTLPDFLRKTPVRDLAISNCPSLDLSCSAGGGGTEGPKIAHIPNIKIYRRRLSHRLY